MGMMLIDRMWERVEIARQDSDTALCLELLYYGEMIAKIAIAGMVAAIDDDRERNRYRQAYRLVRADGIGEWSSVLDDILSGPASQYLREQARDEQRELTSKNPPGSWQHEAVTLIYSCVSQVEPNCDKLPTKIDGRRWISLFATLRNKTRGHGAPSSDLYGCLCDPLEQSIRLFVDNFRLFKRPWAYLYRNLSGKYRVTKFTQPASEFDVLKTRQNVNLQEGVYIYFDQPAHAELIYSTVDALDFLFPNGAFNDKTFEIISYITNSKKYIDSSPYLRPVTPLPTSETQGIGTLEIQGKCFGNLPPQQMGYIHRNELETSLVNVLKDDRHPIITLVGKGGIGKTWLTLAVLHEMTATDRFSLVLWFSSRDIDLLPTGPKPVKPHILTTKDVATEFVRLVGSPENSADSSSTTDYLAKIMTKSDFGPILFVFDNFETIRVPLEMYSWIDTYIRLPNKVLITTRIREFKGDYPIEVFGMNEHESEELINSTAQYLGITNLLTEEYKAELYRESIGHPYVMKVLLGEVAKAGKLVKIDRIAATIDGILDALFERTYSGLSPVAKRLFLTTCCWRSAVPLLALEAVLLRPLNERMDVAAAAEELTRSSFIEMSGSAQNEGLFLSIPLIAAVFGKRKLATSPMRSAIEVDVQMLYAFGAAQQTDIKLGITPRIEKLFRYIAERLSKSKESIDSHLPMLEFIAGKFPPAWILLAKLYQELDSPGNLEKAKEAIRRYIESTPKDYEGQESAWNQLANLCQITEDTEGEIQARVELCQLPAVPFNTVSDAVNRVNALFYAHNFIIDSDEKQIISQRLAQVMENRITEGDATDCSRLAWLFVRLQQRDSATSIIKMGLSLDPDNVYCKKLAQQIPNYGQ